jgi:transcriptional regulator with XRE-family HTH domain
MGRPAPLLDVHQMSFVRRQQGWTYRDLAEVLGARVGMAANPQKPWRWEHRGVVPDEDTQQALAVELGVSVGRLKTNPWPGWLPAGEVVPTALPWTRDGCLQLLDRTVDSMTDRRAFLTLSAGAAAAMATTWATAKEPPAQDCEAQGDDPLVAFEQRLPLMRDMEARQDGESARIVLDTELRNATTLLRSETLGAAGDRRLLAVIAELARLTGWASVDAGRHAAAETYFTAGLRAAHQAGDLLTGANILKCTSLMLLDHHRVNEAVSVTWIAQTRAATGPARVRAMLAVRHARALAARRDVHGAEHLLLQADAAMDRAHGQDGSISIPDWARYFDTAEYSAQVASVYLALGRHAAAERWLDQALALHPTDRRDSLTYLLWRAEAAISGGQVDQGCTLVAEALPRLAGSASVRNRGRFAEVRSLLRQHRTLPEVRELDERTRALVA